MGNLRTIVQPARMRALKPDSVGRPPGVATRSPTADTALHGNKNIIENSTLHPGTNWRGRPKDGDAAPTANKRARKRESQARLLWTATNKKTRRTFSAQTRDTPLGSRVTSQSDMKVTLLPSGASLVWALKVRLFFLSVHRSLAWLSLFLALVFGVGAAAPDLGFPPQLVSGCNELIYVMFLFPSPTVSAVGDLVHTP